MDKTYHFLAGLPRSGNTLLSSILNQNPDIYSSPLSPVPELIWNYKGSYYTEAINRNKDNKIKADIFLSSFIDNFYKDVKKPIVIDREKAWGTPANLALIKEYITPTPKIIFTVRDILDILASFVKMDANYLKTNTANSGSFHLNYRSEKDSVVEHLMSDYGDIDKALLSLSSAFLPENKGVFHIVEYNDLVLKVEVDNDESIGLPKNLHDIRKSISKSTTNTDILSDYIKHKYSNMEFWRDNSLMKIKGRDF